MTEFLKVAQISDLAPGEKMLVEYDEARKATESGERFRRYYLPDADSSGIALLENGKWAAVKAKKQLLAVVLEADSRELAENLLQKIHWP